MRLWLLLICIFFAATVWAAPSQRAFVVLHSQHAGLPVADGIANSILASVRAAGYDSTEIAMEYLDLVRNPDPEYRRMVAELIRHKLAGRKVEVVFAEGMPALDFFLRDGAEIFRDAVVISNMPYSDTTTDMGSRKMIHFPWRPDVAGTLRLAQAAMPGLRKVLVITGGSIADAPFTRLVNEAIPAFAGQLEIELTHSLPYDEMLEKVRKAEPGSAVIYLLHFGDVTGRSTVPAEVARTLAAESPVPLFGTSEIYLPMGFTGGSMLRIDHFGQEIGRLALDYLRGSLPLEGPVTQRTPTSFPMFNWTQLARWNISPDRLPADSIWLERQPTLWEQYRNQVVAVAVAFIAMSAMLIALLVQGRHRRTAEMAARRSEARFRLLISAAPEAIIVLDIEAQRVVDANANALQLLGCSRDKLLSGNLHRFYRAEQPDGLPLEESVLLYQQRALAGEIVVVERVVVRESDGEEFHCDTRMVILPPEPREPRQLRVTFTDITTRKAIEAALVFAATQDDSRPLATFATDMLRLLCRLGRFDHAVLMRLAPSGAPECLGMHAEAAASATDIGPEVLAGLAFPALTAQREITLIADAAREQLPPSALLDAWQTCSFAFAPLWASPGRLMGFIALSGQRRQLHLQRTQSVLQVVAVRAAKELQGMQTAEAAARYRGELEHQVAVRTAELARTNEDLSRARDEAENATRAKSAFLANMSHEIRTPMNAIIGMSQLALRQPLDAKARNYVEKVSRSAETLLGIINDILDFSKIEAGKLELEQRAFALDEVMTHLANLIGIRAAARGLALQFELANGLPATLVGDALRLGQVLTNLGNNAVKFTERGRIVVSVCETRRDADGIELHFSVADTGIGMSADECARLFESFSQADSSTSRKYGGTGLGLAISKRIVEAMHGRIWVDSAPGCGSTFHFTARFGLAAASDVGARQHALAEQGDALTSSHARRLKGLRILLVEDNELNRELATDLLTSVGVEVDVAENGQIALERLAGQPRYDGILMDCQMPVLDGYAATHRIRQNPAWSSLPIIAMTANALATDRDKALAAGMNDHIAKPLDVSTMFACIARWMAPADARSDAGTSEPTLLAAPPTGTDAANAPLPPLAGIDSARGLATCMGKMPLYRNLLQRFASGTARFADDFAAARTQDDHTTMIRLAHTVKGSAASIGAQALADLCAALEAACEPGQPGEDVDTRLQPVLAELRRVHDGLTSLDGAPAGAALPDTISGTTPGTAPGNTPTASLTPALLAEIDALYALVDSGDTEAEVVAQVLLDKVHGTAAEQPLVRIRAALEEFDFDTASALLAELRSAQTG